MRLGFTLVEISIASLVISILAASIVTCLCFLAAIANATLDTRSAQDRAEKVFAILKLPIAHCGYGMPKESAEYTRSFNSIRKNPFDWPGPASVDDFTSAGGMRNSAVCRLVYAIPSRIVTMREASVSESNARIPVDGKLDTMEVAPNKTNPNSTKNWIVFGATLPVSCPFWLSGPPEVSGSETILALSFVNPLPDDSKKLIVPENDELCAIRAMKCWVDGYNKNDFALYTDDLLGSGAQPRVIGVIDARFEIAASRNLLRVFLITRGNKRYNYEVSTTPPPGWPEGYATTISPEAKRYKLYTHRASFELRNF
ncbi:MAG: prepilin-type N-terminal cleavage/methylation domain-containing protein [Synergistaceae bacterium]|nr:prepilin-type N-terminal cleavage/methylation domain-containing protein [Synergistaceae bacterium]